jgi:predicted PurR-regulated permease PerM
MTSPNAPTGDTGETIRRLLATLLIMLLAVASLWLLAPFLPAIIWAGTIAIATWPILLYLTRQFGGRRGLAVTVMTLAILICFLFPILGLVAVVVDHASDVGRLATAISASGLPDAPAWVASIPLVGSKVAARWHELALLRGDEVIEQASPWLSQVSGWLLSKAGGLALMVLQILLTAIVAALLFGSGEQVAAGIRTFARRLGGDRADEVVILAAKAVRGVALGVVVTALAQSVIGGLALVATGVPAAGLLTAIIFFLCLALLVWSFGRGNHSPGRHHLRGGARQRPATDADQEGSRSPPVAGVHRRHRRHAGGGSAGHLRGPGDPGRDLYPPRGVGGPGRGEALIGRAGLVTP